MSTKTEHCANCGGHLTEENIRLAVEDATGIPRGDLIFYCPEYAEERCPGWAKEDETKAVYWTAR